MKLAVLSVIFKQNLKYFNDFINSLNNQTDNNFTFILLIDNFDFKLNDYTFPNNTKILNIDYPTTIANNRKLLIDEAANLKMDVIAFADTDDIFHKDKIEILKSKLNNNGFIFHDMFVFKKDNEISKDTFYQNLNTTTDFIKDNILRFNLIGLGNSAIDLLLIKDIDIPNKIKSVDWLIFSNLIINGCNFKFINDSLSYYRQHINNIIGANKFLNETLLELGIENKKMIYQNLLNCNQNDFKYIRNAYERIIKLEEKILFDKSFKNIYIRKINQNIDKIYKGWWSQILTIEEWKKL